MMKQIIFAAAFALAALTTTFAQAPTSAPAATPTAALAVRPAAAATIPPPVAPILAIYRFWPEQFIQWIGTELPYSMVELDVDQLKSSAVYDVVLTERATQKRIHYSNLPLVVAAVKAQDGEGYLANDITLERPDAVTTGATYTLKLTLHDGKPLEWRFIQGSDVVEQGGGLSAFPNSPVLIFAYREQAAVAGEGTSIQIGDAVSAAEPWKEVSRPPYFMAWHGAYSLNATTLVLPGGEEKWTVASAPAELKTGDAWKLTSTNGREMDIEADKVEGHHASLTVTAMPGATKRTVEADWDGSAWHYTQLRFIPHPGEKAGLTMQFAPELSGDGPSSLEILVGKKKIVTASASANAAKGVSIEFKSPDWVKGKTVSESEAMRGSEVTLESSAH